MVLAAGLVVLALLCFYVGMMIPSRGAQEFVVPAYAFLILAAVRFVWARCPRGERGRCAFQSAFHSVDERALRCNGRLW